MIWYFAIPFTFGIILISCIISWVLSSITGLSYIPGCELVVLGTTIWAAIDSKKLEFKKYKSAISYGPVVMFLVIGFLWIIAFPWYLHVRYKIKNGLAELKSNQLDQKTENLVN